MDGDSVEQASSPAVDCGWHDDVSLDIGSDPGLNDSDVGSALVVGLLGVAGELILIYVFGVGENAGLAVGTGQGMVGKGGGA